MRVRVGDGGSAEESEGGEGVAELTGRFADWMSALGWAAGIASTGILVSLTYASLAAASNGRGFTYWLFLTMIVACNLGAFCVTPYVLVRGTVGRREPTADRR